MSQGTRNTVQDFWARVDKIRGGCWHWLGTWKRRYGEISFEGKRYHAHRLCYELVHGHRPRMMARTCESPRCINPDHYEVGGFKLNEADETRIRQLHASGNSGAFIARLYGVTQPLIWLVLHGRPKKKAKAA